MAENPLSAGPDPIIAEQAHLDRLRAVIDRLEREESGRISDLLAAPTTDLTERDDRIAHHGGRLARLRAARFGLLFGAIQTEEGEWFRIGRIGLADPEGGARLLVDWRAPVSRAFYTATPLHRDGIRARRRISSTGSTVTAVYDEPLILEDLEGAASGPDTALMAALEQPRSAHMGDIVGTIQREQDAIIRAPLPGTLVVQGGPGTGKTAVALHRAAYLLYEHRERLEKSVVLILGPTPTFLDYIGQVLPSLGEDSAVLMTPGTLVPGYEATGVDPEGIAAIKGSLEMARVLSDYIARLQVPAAEPSVISTSGSGTLRVTPAVLGRVRTRIRKLGLGHNAARPRFETAYLAEIIRQENRALAEVVEFLGDAAERRREWAADPAVRAEFARLWPLLEPEAVLRDLLSDERALAELLPGLGEEERARLLRARDAELTPADIVLIDELSELLGTDPRPAAAARARARRARQREMEFAHGVLDMLSDTTAEEDGGGSFLGVQAMVDRQAETDDRSPAERAAADREWVYGHVIVDEAQEISPLLLRALLRRCPTRSMTLVGDAHQYTASAAGFSWEGLLAPALKTWEMRTLSVNYRTPGTIMELASALLARFAPGEPAAVSIREGVHAPKIHRVPRADLPAAARELARVAAAGDPGTVALIGAHLPALGGVWVGDGDASKGLEFDTVIVVLDPPVDPGPADWARLYVALTRPTQRLHVVVPEDRVAGLSWLPGL